MDRSWVHGTLFSREYISRIKEFMDFIQEKFGEDDEILCPCSRCLNQKYVRRKSVSDRTYEKPLHREDEQGVIFEADVVARLMKDKNIEVYGNEGEDEEGDTVMEYCSENEGGAAMDVDSDDD